MLKLHSHKDLTKKFNLIDIESYFTENYQSIEIETGMARFKIRYAIVIHESVTEN